MWATRSSLSLDGPTVGWLRFVQPHSDLSSDRSGPYRRLGLTPAAGAMHSPSPAPARCPPATSSPPPRASSRATHVVMARGGRRHKPPPSAPEAEQPEALSRILRTEAAVSGVSRKAAAASRQQSTRLWPRAVLEALDSAVASCRWESALEVTPNPLEESA